MSKDLDLETRLAARGYKPQDYIPGFAVRFIELENACAFLVGQGWAGLMSFDEAVMALLPRPKKLKDDADG